jgi:UDP-N-acetylmuramyl tripeptide synthase
MNPSLRTDLARRAALVSALAARFVPGFQGQTLPGRIALAIDPDFLSHRHAKGLATRSIVVTGTNGKTTTTAFVRALLGPTALANRGSNLPWGVATVLAKGDGHAPGAVFEVDEAYVPSVATSLAPAVLVWLNMSRDQLDRNLEVRRLAARIAESAAVIETVVANASDPLIVANANHFRRSIWIKGPEGWHQDAQSCPRCTGELTYESQWRCEGCGLSEPQADYEVDEQGRVRARGSSLGVLDPGLPGGFNLLNALMAAVAVGEATGKPLGELIGRVSVSTGVDGRFGTWWLTKLATTPSLVTYLAKNPAGWHANLSLIGALEGELVLGLNARVADGRDTSWIWDVDFETLYDSRSLTRVIATGERATDLALRLEVAGFDVTVVSSQVEALRLAARRQGSVDPTGSVGKNRILYLGNYTAFRALVSELETLGAIPEVGAEVVS